MRRRDGVNVPGSPLKPGFFEFFPGDRSVVADSGNITYVLDRESFDVLYTRSEQPDGKSTVRWGE